MNRIAIGLLLLVGCAGCGSSQNRHGVQVDAQVYLGDKLIQTRKVEVAASNLVNADWLNGTFPTLEVAWRRQPDLLFHEVWIGFQSSDAAKRELLGYSIYSVRSDDRIRINYPSTKDLYLTLNLQDIPSADRSRIRQVTLVYRIDDSKFAGDSDVALNQRAWLLATIPLDAARDGELATHLAKKACEKSSWKNPDYVDTLAASHAEADQFSDAIQTQEKAIALIGAQDPRRVDFEARLAKYRKGQKHRSLLSDL